jgi:ABC-type sugar transport system substrate-binding protein
MKRATLRDIAAALGVTVATVSRALKDYPDISSSTKQAVLATAERLNYAPHPLAVKLRQKAYKVVGVVVPDIVHPFFSDVISGIVDVVERLGYHVILSQSNESYEKEVRVTQMLQATGIDGLLMCLSNETVAVDHLRALQDYDLPVVLFDKISPGLDASTVVTNDFQGAYDAVAHLLDQGYTRVAHIKGPAHPENTRQRFAGYRAALTAYNLPFRPEYVAECHAVTHAEGYAFRPAVPGPAGATRSYFCCFRLGGHRGHHGPEASGPASASGHGRNWLQRLGRVRIAGADGELRGSARLRYWVPSQRAVVARNSAVARRPTPGTPPHGAGCDCKNSAIVAAQLHQLGGLGLG